MVRRLHVALTATAHTPKAVNVVGAAAAQAEVQVLVPHLLGLGTSMAAAPHAQVAFELPRAPGEDAVHAPDAGLKVDPHMAPQSP